MKSMEMFESSIGDYSEARGVPRVVGTVLMKPVAIARTRKVERPVAPKVGMNWADNSLSFVIVNVEASGRVWYYRREIDTFSVVSTTNPGNLPGYPTEKVLEKYWEPIDG